MFGPDLQEMLKKRRKWGGGKGSDVIPYFVVAAPMAVNTLSTGSQSSILLPSGSIEPLIRVFTSKWQAEAIARRRRIDDKDFIMSVKCKKGSFFEYEFKRFVIIQAQLLKKLS